MHQARLASETVAVGIHVGGEADPLAGAQHLGEGPGGSDFFGGKRERHGAKIIRWGPAAIVSWVTYGGTALRRAQM